MSILNITDRERELAAEIDELRAALKERDALRAANKDLQDWYDAAQANEKRYQWLRDYAPYLILEDVLSIEPRNTPQQQLDEAIDKLMKEEQS